MEVHGRCHCGNISFTLLWQPEPTEIPARACTCTFCVKHGGVWTACSGGELAIQIRDPHAVHHYAFGTHTADFHVCRQCGVVPVVTSALEGAVYAVVNVNTFEGDAAQLVRTHPVSFDGESEAARLERRRRNWIARVRYAQ